MTPSPIVEWCGESTCFLYCIWEDRTTWDPCSRDFLSLTIVTASCQNHLTLTFILLSRSSLWSCSNGSSRGLEDPLLSYKCECKWSSVKLKILLTLLLAKNAKPNGFLSSPPCALQCPTPLQICSCPLFTVKKGFFTVSPLGIKSLKWPQDNTPGKHPHINARIILLGTKIMMFLLCFFFQCVMFDSTLLHAMWRQTVAPAL